MDPGRDCQSGLEAWRGGEGEGHRVVLPWPRPGGGEEHPPPVSLPSCFLLAWCGACLQCCCCCPKLRSWGVGWGRRGKRRSGQQRIRS